MDPDREENFEAWLNKQFEGREPAEDEDPGGAMADEAVALCEQYGVPIKGALMFPEKFSEVLKILATIHTRSKILEDEGIARRGFADDLQAMILRHLTQSLQARPQ